MDFLQTLQKLNEEESKYYSNKDKTEVYERKYIKGPYPNGTWKDLYMNKNLGELIPISDSEYKEIKTKQKEEQEKRAKESKKKYPKEKDVKPEHIYGGKEQMKKGVGLGT